MQIGIFWYMIYISLGTCQNSITNGHIYNMIYMYLFITIPYEGNLKWTFTIHLWTNCLGKDPMHIVFSQTGGQARKATMMVNLKKVQPWSVMWLSLEFLMGELVNFGVWWCVYIYDYICVDVWLMYKTFEDVHIPWNMMVGRCNSLFKWSLFMKHVCFRRCI